MVKSNWYCILLTNSKDMLIRQFTLIIVNILCILWKLKAMMLYDKIIIVHA